MATAASTSSPRKTSVAPVIKKAAKTTSIKSPTKTKAAAKQATPKATSKPATDKPPMGKKSAAKKATTRPRKQSRSISPEERHRMICDAAYFRAEHRGFANGDPQQDWLEAEQEIEALQF